MDKLHYPFPLKCFKELQHFASVYMDQFNKDDLYLRQLDTNGKISSILNLELAEYGLPKVRNLLCIKRKNFDISKDHLHVDGNRIPETGQVGMIHASIIIPLDGCRNTCMFWMGGDYTLTAQIRIDEITNKAVPFWAINWYSIPSLLDNVEIYDVPTITRVDVPHSANSNIDGTYRSVLTVRLEGNPTFDEIVKIRFGVL